MGLASAYAANFSVATSAPPACVTGCGAPGSMTFSSLEKKNRSPVGSAAPGGGVAIRRKSGPAVSARKLQPAGLAGISRRVAAKAAAQRGSDAGTAGSTFTLVVSVASPGTQTFSHTIHWTLALIGTLAPEASDAGALSTLGSSTSPS